MASLEDPYDFTQPTQPFEEATQVTQDDPSLGSSHEKPIGKVVWKRGDLISDHDIFLDSTVVIGRHKSCHILVTSTVSSNRHCTISAIVEKESRDVLIVCEDLSSNGTFWNGKKIGKNKSVILSHGDVIEIKKGHYFTYLQLNKTRSGSNKEVDPIESKYQITDTVLGKGTFAEIRLVYRKDTQQQLAVKVMEKRNFTANGTAGGGTNYIHEINLLRGIKHANIVRVFDVAETPRHVYIFMPLLRGGDLFDYIYDHERIDEDESKFIIYQVLLALKYLHDANIAHRDLKPENTLLVKKSAYSQVMLTDFGMAKATGQQELMKTMCGTFQYIAPEMISSGAKPGEAVKVGYTTTVDCWSLGVMTYAMVSGMLPFSDEDGNPQILFSQILSGELDFSFPCWRTLSSECQAFIRRLLCVSPSKRMTVDEAFKHDWIAQDEAKLAKLYAECIRDGDMGTEPTTPAAADSPHSTYGAAGAQRRGRGNSSDDTTAANTAAANGVGAMGPPPAKRVRQVD
ncbi:hypothetical protein IWW57_000180 [Coemansia sp. S610]|nr:hypothetical protein IWW57_000180 [Coemansia sp. S610]KAJ2405755.1 hypothetical protein GGI10_005313 [Coemansia sp. RSA 2530]KAJ2696628.1 hypothetical protein H4218_004491 [Coemansia sp. IMI 209128]